MTDDPRLNQLQRWLESDLSIRPTRVASASADASFRRYFRIWRATGDTLIVMDAPPDKEDLGAYLRVSSLLASCKVHVPHVYEATTEQGFALIEDLGSTQMLTSLSQGGDAEVLYADALTTLAQLQTRGIAAASRLAPYDRATLLREMSLMPEWFCSRHLDFALNGDELEMLKQTFEWLIADALAQPQVFVHRDYHSRNLMVLDERSPGVIDFQDALRGPVGYDLVSILKDCYVQWPRSKVESWASLYRNRLRADGEAGTLLAGESLAQLLRWMDLIGLQRHIKVLGIFARLNWRDGKSGYLADLPRTLEYVRETASRFAELRHFSDFVNQRLVPALPAANLRALANANQ